MQIDATAFRAITSSVLPAGTALSAVEAVAVVHAGQLAAGLDLDDDRDEQSVLGQLVRHISATAGIPVDRVPRVSPLPIDDEERRAWIDRLASGLRTPGVSELAYIVVYLVTVADLELSPVESAFTEQFREALGIGRDRARDLTVTVSSMLTPGVPDGGPGAEQTSSLNRS